MIATDKVRKIENKNDKKDPNQPSVYAPCMCETSPIFSGSYTIFLASEARIQVEFDTGKASFVTPLTPFEAIICLVKKHIVKRVKSI
jgi:hypothetical protein